MSRSDLPPSAGFDSRSLSERLSHHFWRLWKRLLQRLGRHSPRMHVLVAGTQRSGTNMLMEVMDWSRYTEVIHETDPRGFARYEMRPIVEIQDMARRSIAPFFVIKSLCELDRLGVLMDGIAPAKTLWIVRSFDDSVRSMVRSFANFAEQLRRLSVDKDGGTWRGRGMSDETQALIRRLYHPDMSEASAAALMWYYRNVLFFEQGLDQDPRVCVIFYEDLVRQPEVEFARVFRFLGIPGWSPWICRKIHTRSRRETPYDAIAPEVREVCETLLARFQSVRTA